jgi:transcriptional regulator with XRE-family HTH domain
MNTRTRTWRVRSSHDLGLAIKELRHSRKLEQREVADALGMDRSYLSRLEGGRRSILLDRILRVLRYLGAEVTLSWSEDPDA